MFLAHSTTSAFTSIFSFFFLLVQNKVISIWITNSNNDKIMMHSNSFLVLFWFPFQNNNKFEWILKFLDFSCSTGRRLSNSNLNSMLWFLLILWMSIHRVRMRLIILSFVPIDIHFTFDFIPMLKLRYHIFDMFGLGLGPHSTLSFLFRKHV